MPEAIPEKAQVVRCKSLQEFRAALRPPGGHPIYPLFRGQANDGWPLVAPNARFRHSQCKAMGKTVRVDGKSIGKGQITYFRHLAIGMPGVDIEGMGDIDIEALARHNGLCSNLLDWSLSYFVALFFAYSGAIDSANNNKLLAGSLSDQIIAVPSGSIAIWRLSIGDDILIPDEFEHLHTLSKQNYWQKAQRGSFTRLSHENYLDIEEYLASRGLLDRLTKFVLPANIALSVMRDLEDMNITFSTLSPDLRGAALQANCGATWQISGGITEP